MTIAVLTPVKQPSSRKRASRSCTRPAKPISTKTAPPPKTARQTIGFAPKRSATIPQIGLHRATIIACEKLIVPAQTAETLRDGWIAKGGAEGLYCAADADGLGIALKCEDGAYRAIGPALAEVLDVDELREVPVRNSRGEVVGSIS